MSSIAYLTDTNMLDYHRLKGNQTMAFWRFSLKDFARFSQGDLFFFIDRRERHPHTNEKGLVGYGRCASIKNLSISQTWKTYKTATGYNTYKNFQDSVRYYRKNDHRLPAQIQTILLEDVIFFQHPIFLSEIGIALNERLESFTYIEKEGRDASNELIDIASKVGMDLWMMSQNPEVFDYEMDKDREHQALRNQMMLIDVEYDKEQIRLLKNHTKSVAHHNIYYSFENSNLIIYLPLTKRSQFNAIIGIYTLLKASIDYDKTQYVLITNLNLDSKMVHLLNLLNLELEQI